MICRLFRTAHAWAFLLPALILAAFVPWLASSGQYYLGEGTAMISLWSSARSISQSLAEPDLDPKDRAFLERVQDIRAYARDTLGLKENRNYTTWIKTDQDAVAYVVSACEELSFDQFLWNYPVVGRLPYQGYFRKDDAVAYAKTLKAQGLDVMVRGVSGFSTLGWMSDPLFSFMEDYPLLDLAELIIHEQTHATLFVQGQGDFNENLAYFVGKEGARAYVRDRQGSEAPPAQAADLAQADEVQYYTLIHHLFGRLDRCYRDTSLTLEQKRSIKTGTIQQFLADWDRHYSAHFKSQDYRGFAKRPLNNASIMTYRNYTARQDLFQAAFDAHGKSIPAFMSWLDKEIKAGRPVPGL